MTILWWYRLQVIAGFQSRLTLRWNVQPLAQAGVAINLLACFCFWTLLWYEPESRMEGAIIPTTRNAPDSPPPA